MKVGSAQTQVDCLPVRIRPRWKDSQSAEGHRPAFRRDAMIAKDFGTLGGSLATS